ncbi:GTP-binding protein RAD-like [Littorina saxatilis]|uniref:GTP-binding protein RAD-like n=1 Tax=Littorina saxatilis TaxID=31220 RepID=UPI0038B5BFBF
MLDGEESMIEFTEGPTVSQESNYDAYIIVFSVTDRSSFDVAAFLMRHLRVEVGTDRAIILVANKVDLVRQRRVTNSEARELATTFDGKYTETSAALNDHVDDLLVGTLSQIRFQLCPPPTSFLTPPSSPKSKCRTPSPLSLFSRFVKYATRKSNSCDNLLLQ